MGIKKKMTEFFRSIINKTDCYNFYFDLLKSAAVSSFEWENLPPSIDERFMETILFERGSVLIFRDDVTEDLLCLPYTSWGPLSIYNEPINRRAYANNRYNYPTDIEHSVIIYNNVLRTPSIRQTEIFANRLAEQDVTIDVNVHAQKTPVLILCDENEQLTMKNLYKDYDGNVPVIFGSRGLGGSPITSVKTDAPYVADKLYQLKVNYWNEYLTYLGVANLNLQKKERLIVDEVQRAQGGVMICRDARLFMRRQACEKINRMFGTNISVRFREDMENTDQDAEPDPEQEGGEQNE